MSDTISSKRLLSEYAVGRDNNFNLLRFAAATAVVASHSVAVTRGADAYSPLRAAVGMDVGNVAVDVFFVTSGFLVTGSLLKRSMFDFARARIRRVYPAYIVSLLFCIFIVGAFATTMSLSSYFTSLTTFRFAAKNAALLLGSAFALPGVFEGLPVSGVVNGSLWTLPWEGRMYVVLAVIGSLSVLCKATELTTRLIYAIGITLFVSQLLNDRTGFFPPKGLQVAYMFFAGAMLYVFKEKIRLSRGAAWICCCLLMLVIFNAGLFRVVYLVLFPYLVLALAYLPSGTIRKFNNCGDYSYGIYIYSFPIQQLLVLKFALVDPTVVFFVSFILTLLMAVVSWHWIEKPFLTPAGHSAMTNPKQGVTGQSRQTPALK